MKYYSLKYKNIDEGYGQQRMWRITIVPGYEDDKGLLEHEKLHVRQWYVTTAIVALIGVAAGWLAHPLWLVILIWSPWSFGNFMQMAWFRRTIELYGYKRQAEYSSAAMAQRMVEILVKMGVSRKRAERALL